MFVLPPTWEETRELLLAILVFCDHAPFLYVSGERGVEQIDFGSLCASLPSQLDHFLRTGLREAWRAPMQIHGAQADWLLLPCGVMPSRPEDFVLKWNVRALHQEPAWALNHPGFAAFHPALVQINKQQGRLLTYVWAHIWQQAVATFFHADPLQQLQALRAFCATEIMVNVQWLFKEESLLLMLTPAQLSELSVLQQNDRVVDNSALTHSAVQIIVDGTLVLPPMACFQRQNGCLHNASYFCTVCAQMYCNLCAHKSEHVGHVFKECSLK